MTYEFECKICGRTKNITALMNDIQNIKPICCDYAMQRIFNAVPIKFNGSGFHSTDYKPKKPIEKDGYCSSKTHTDTTSAERSNILRDD